MASQEDIEEINDYLKQQRGKQPADQVEKPGFFGKIQHAIFGETHADYPPRVTPTDSATPQELLSTPNNSPPPAARTDTSTRADVKGSIPNTPKKEMSAPMVDSASTQGKNATTPTNASSNVSPSIITPSFISPPKMEGNNPSAMKTAPRASAASTATPPAPQSIPQAAPAVIPPASSPRAPAYMASSMHTPPAPMKNGMAGSETSASPPASRFNPYPLPYSKPSPAPATFSDTTAPPWVMRTLPAESRDAATPFPTSVRTEKESRAMTETKNSARAMVAAPAAPISSSSKKNTSLKSNATVPVPAAAAPVAASIISPRNDASTREQVKQLISETQNKDGNDSGHRMPWHEPGSQEISPDELVGIRASRATPAMNSRADPQDVLSANEHAYLARKEKEYDLRGGSPTPSAAVAARAASAGDVFASSTPPIVENTTNDEKQAILARLKEMMAQHGANSTP